MPRLCNAGHVLYQLRLERIRYQRRRVQRAYGDRRCGVVLSLLVLIAVGRHHPRLHSSACIDVRGVVGSLSEN